MPSFWEHFFNHLTHQPLSHYYYLRWRHCILFSILLILLDMKKMALSCAGDFFIFCIIQLHNYYQKMTLIFHSTLLVHSRVAPPATLWLTQDMTTKTSPLPPFKKEPFSTQLLINIDLLCSYNTQSWKEEIITQKKTKKILGHKILNLTWDR